MTDAPVFLVVSPGSPSAPRPGRTALDHGETRRACCRFASVPVGLQAGTPSVGACVSAVAEDWLVVVPLFVSDDDPVVGCIDPIGPPPSFPAVVRERPTVAVGDAWERSADGIPPGGSHRDASGRNSP